LKQKGAIQADGYSGDNICQKAMPYKLWLLINNYIVLLCLFALTFKYIRMLIDFFIDVASIL
jgi:hypothetical protein